VLSDRFLDSCRVPAFRRPQAPQPQFSSAATLGHFPARSRGYRSPCRAKHPRILAGGGHVVGPRLTAAMQKYRNIVNMRHRVRHAM
jgi:hypothetical protein